MKITRRSKVIVLLVTCVSTLTVIIWTAYLCSVIWLRAKYARELANSAKPPQVITLTNAQSPHTMPASGWLLMEIAQHPAIERLESLQQPTLGTVLRLVLGRDTNADGGQFTILSSSGLVLIGSETETTLQLAVGQSPAGYVTCPVNGDQSVNQVFTKIFFTDIHPNIQFVSATDSFGEKVLVVMRSLDRDDDSNEQAAATEIMLIDMAGRIFHRSQVPKQTLLGKLTEPHGKADQLVFGTVPYNAEGGFDFETFSPVVVRIIEDRQLRVVRTIHVPNPSATHDSSPTSVSEELQP